jgi:hypothetical protein
MRIHVIPKKDNDVCLYKHFGVDSIGKSCSYQVIGFATPIRSISFKKMQTTDPGFDQLVSGLKSYVDAVKNDAYAITVSVTPDMKDAVLGLPCVKNDFTIETGRSIDALLVFEEQANVIKEDLVSYVMLTKNAGKGDVSFLVQTIKPGYQSKPHMHMPNEQHPDTTKISETHMGLFGESVELVAGKIMYLNLDNLSKKEPGVAHAIANTRNHTVRNLVVMDPAPKKRGDSTPVDMEWPPKLKRN